MIGKDRLAEIVRAYVSTDYQATGCDSSYVVNDMLRDVCGCTDEEITELGLGWLLTALEN